MAITLFVFCVSFSNSYSFNTLTVTALDLNRDFIEIIKTNNGTVSKNNKIEMCIKNGIIVISEGQNITLHKNSVGLINGDSISNIGSIPIKVINSDGSEIFVGPGVKNRVKNNKLEILKWYEFWK